MATSFGELLDTLTVTGELYEKLEDDAVQIADTRGLERRQGDRAADPRIGREAATTIGFEVDKGLVGTAHFDASVQQGAGGPQPGAREKHEQRNGRDDAVSPDHSM